MKKLLLLISGLYLAIAPLSAQDAIQKMTYFLKLLQSQYVDEVNLDSMVEIGIKEILAQMDPHSVYMNPEELKKANEPLEGSFEGVGVQFNILEDTIVVVHVIIGGPSQKVGIMDGDKIVTINGENVGGIGIDNAGVFKRLRGPKGTEVTVGVKRNGEPELLEFLIVRDKIPLYALDASYMIDKKTGYIKLSRFSATATAEVSDAIDSLKSLGMKNLILDLTGNSGGYLNQAHTLADLFIDDEKLIVYTEGRAFPRQDLNAGYPGNFEKGRLVIMIDGGSASASEIVSGAVQDWDRGILVGRRTYGKGLVQKGYNLPDQSAVRLTMARYYTPSGRSIQRPYKGIKDKYREDMIDRIESGELFDEAKVSLSDSTPFYTNNKRVVYGGGGIMPDVYVPVDTTWRSDFYNKLLRKGTFSRFTLKYVNDRRGALLQQYPTLDAFVKHFKVDSTLWNDFLAYAASMDVKSEESYENSRHSMETQLKAMVAQYLFDSKAYYRIINELNPIYNKAVKVIMDNKLFKDLKIEEN
jgi:carboxyl-terminal processing protease